MPPAIQIATELKQASNGKLALGVLEAIVTVSRHDQALWREIDECVSRLANTALEDIAPLTPVRALRETYKALGTDPSRYRGSNEALLRRSATRQFRLLELRWFPKNCSIPCSTHRLS